MIRQLDTSLINKIAAGEVVERPLSIVKELTENAIDAGAKLITVEITDGGTTLVRVTDNGGGIPKADMPLVFARHATSKISSFDELMSVGTLGFRGEALSSIAAVAQVELVTKTADAETASLIAIHGGQLISSRETSAPTGTTISVSNIFFNTPARRKFLKNPATEAGYISHCLERLALASPATALRYMNNGKLVFATTGDGNLRHTIAGIYGHEAASAVLSVDAGQGSMRLGGVVGKPQIARGNRRHAAFFVNGRYIDSKLLTRAVENAMRTLLPHGKFPMYVLELTLPSTDVDVNVHPTKMDVRFADERGVAAFVENAVRDALEEGNLAPTVRWTPPQPKTEEPEQLPIFTVVQHIAKDEPQLEMLQEEHANEASAATPPAAPRFPDDFTIHGLAFATYWLVSAGESLFLIDQHAAHERILYEEILQKSREETVPSQRLLAPVSLRLTQRECETLRENMRLFEQFGFEIDVDTNAAQVFAVPLLLRAPADTAFFVEILDKLDSDNGQTLYAHKPDVVAAAACAAAVKGGDCLNEAEARAMITRLLTLANPFTCPHGRPTMIDIPRREIERRMGR
jgi:DNA mismatch repair protein MutL